MEMDNDLVNNMWTRQEAVHLLNRAGYGGHPEEIVWFHQRGREGAVDWLLNQQPDSWDMSSWVNDIEKAVAQVKKMRLNKELTESQRDELRSNIRKKRRKSMLDLTYMWVKHMSQTRSPFVEKMTFFWHDHFPSTIKKVKSPRALWKQNELFRSQALGNVRTLTNAIARDPAMMCYLDMHRSKKSAPNENFSRELFELFTLGEGHYSEMDIKEAARAFTGYRCDLISGTSRLVKSQWDQGQKTIFGQTGAFNAQDVVSLVFKQPRCAVFIVEKLVAYFGHESPSKQLIEQLSTVLKKENYSIKPVLRALFLSKEFYKSQYLNSRIKSPVEYIVMLCKQLEVGVPNARILYKWLEELGQVPFFPPNVAGWNWGRSWVTTNSLLTRYQIAGYLTTALTLKIEGKRKIKKQTLEPPNYEKIAPVSLRQNPEKLIEHLAGRFLSMPIKKEDFNTLVRYAQAKKTAHIQDSEVAEIVHLMLSSPYYQIH